MTFTALNSHFEENGCSLDHIQDNIYIAKNCINGHVCIIEDIPFYNISTLSHYFYELHIPVPQSVEDHIHVYELFRKDQLGY